MKASEFKQLIKEAVKEAIQEELYSVKKQTQATEPVLQTEKRSTVQFSGDNPLMEALNMTSRTMSSDDYRNVMNADSSMAASFDRSMFMPKQNFKPVSDDPRAVAQAVAAAPKTGIDISQLGFINKAAAIVNTAAKKDKERFGG